MVNHLLQDPIANIDRSMHLLWFGRSDFGVENHFGVLVSDYAHFENGFVPWTVHAGQQMSRLSRS